MFDGSIRIDTRLDNSGVEIGAKEVEKRINHLCSAINNFGAKMQKAASGSISNIGEILSREYTNNLDGLAAKLHDLGEAQIPTDSFKQLCDNIAKAEAELDRLTDKEQKMMAMGADQPSQAWQKVQRDIDDTVGKLDDFKAKLEEAKEDFAFMNTLEQRNAAHSEGPEGWAAYVSELERLKNYIAESEKEVTKLEAQLEKLYAKRDQLKASGANEGSSQWRSLQYDIEQVTEKLQILRDEQERLQSQGLDFMSGAETAEYQRLSAELEQLQAAMGATQSAMASSAAHGQFFASTLSSIHNAMRAVSTASIDAAKRIASMGFNLVSSGIKRAISALRSYTSQAKKTTLTNNGLVKSLTSLKRLLITRIKRMFISAIFNNVRQGIQTLAQYSSEFKTIMSSLKSSATQMTGNIASAFGTLISAVAPILMYLMNLLSTAITYLNQFFSLLGGKSTYMAAKAGAEGYADAAGGAASAQKKWNNELYSFDELNRQNKNDSSGGSGSGGGVQFEELPIDLPEGIKDWIERLKEAWKNADWFSVGSIIAEGLNEAIKVADDWINTKFHPWFKDWANRLWRIVNGFFDTFDGEMLGKTIADAFNAVFDGLNDFLKNTNWLMIGRTLGYTIKSWFDNIDWKLVGETFARKWNALILTVRGIVTTPGIWTSIGKSIGDFIKSWFSTIDVDSIAETVIAVFNGIAESIRAFLDGNPFEGLADKLASALNRVFIEVNWADLGKTIAELFNALFRTLKDFISRLSWKDVAEAIQSFLSSALQSIDPALLLSAIFLPKLLGAVKALIAAHPVAALAIGAMLALGPKLGETLSKMVDNIDFAAVGKQLSTAIVNVLSRMQAATESVNWQELAKKIFKRLLKMIKNIDFASIAKAMFRLLGAAIGAVAGIGQAIWEALKSAWESVKTYFKGYFDQFGGDIIAGLCEGIAHALVGIGTWIYNNILLPFINGFKAAFGIGSPSRVMAEMGTFLVEGLLQGLSQAWVLLTEFFTTAIESLKEMLSTAWESIKTTALTTWETIKTGTITAFTMAKDTILAAVETLKTGLAMAWQTIKTTAVTTWNNIKTSMTTTITTLKTKISQTMNTIKSSLSATWNSIKATASNAWNSIRSTAISLWTSLSNTLSSKWQNLRTTIANVEWASIGRHLVEGLMNGVGGAWSALVSKVQSLCNSLIAQIKSWFGVHSPSTVFAAIGENLDAGLVKGIEGGEGKLLATAANIANAVTDGMTPDSPNVDVTAEGVVNGMQAVINGLSGIATTFKTIADTLSRIGGLSVPQVAAGTVTPYDVNAASNAAPADSEAGTSNLSDILTEIREQSRLLQLIETAMSKGNNVKVIINGREVFNAVVEENNRAIRRTGASPIRV